VRWPASPILLVAALGIAGAPGQSLPQSSGRVSSQRDLLDRYCAGCHNEKLKTAGVSLQSVDLGNVGAGADTWERVLRKVRRGEMPPPGLPHPDAAARDSFAASLENALDHAAAAHPNPGRPAVHRLNRAEYSNAIRDLLAVDIKPGSLLPVDDSGYGFDNIADVLSMSPALLERYISVARLISRLAVGDLKMKPVEEQFQPLRDPPGQFRRGRQNDRVSDDLPFDSRGGVSVQHYFPVDAEYVFRIKFPNIVVASGERVAGVGDVYELRQPVKAGLRTVGVTFLRESAKPELEAPLQRGAAPVPGMAPPPRALPAKMDLRLDGVRLKRFEVPQRGGATTDITALLVGGPYNPTGRGDTPSRARIFVCRPATAKEEEPCANKILSTLTRRAFRRPVAAADLKPLLAFYRTGRAEADFDTGIERAIEAMLMSPEFLFRVEQDARGAAPGSVYRINDYELASRLSFFLWSSIPDDELLKLAGEGKLKDSAVLRQQVRRLLDDPRSRALVDNFGGQWLHLRNLATVKPDPQDFPEFDESLRRAFQQETEMFFQSVLREDRSLLELLDANYTFLNQRLAEHYGIPRIYGSQFRRVPLSDSNRAGLLGQGSILTVTSYPNRTSVVQRGRWILENLLGAPPPPPPPVVPELKPHAKDGRLLTMREQMEQHRSDPTCASCHSRMDPIGFSLENYDAIGRWRTKDAGSTIDATGKLPDGTEFTGPAGLRKLLLSSYQDDFVTAITEKLLTYALGRGLEYNDKPVVRSVSRQAARDNYRMSAIIMAIVESTPFQMRRAPDP
jgi:mono/diheme cytochrome c family protein